jgi:chemotaxis protein histidine kinase CheA
MNSFAEKFKEEGKEYFEKLESGLLLLEQDPKNFQVVDEIFRIMHSLKGSGGMFGFDLLSDVTHDLESLFDIFRSKKQFIDSTTISFTLNSIDGLYNLMTQDPTEEQRLLAKKMKLDTQKQITRLTLSDFSAEEEQLPSSNQVPVLTTFHLFQTKIFFQTEPIRFT